MLSSKLLNFMFGLSGAVLGSSNFRVDRVHLYKLPLCDLTEKDKLELSKLLDEIQNTNKHLNIIKIPQERKEITQKIIRLEKEINNKIYELYDLTPDEIRIIEETVED